MVTSSAEKEERRAHPPPFSPPHLIVVFDILLLCCPPFVSLLPVVGLPPQHWSGGTPLSFLFNQISPLLSSSPGGRLCYIYL